MSRTNDAKPERSAHQNPNRRAVAEIQRKITKQGKRNAVSRGFHSKNDKDEIAAWRQELNRILHIFNVRSSNSDRPSRVTISPQTELAIDTNVMVADIHRTVVAGQEGTVSHYQPVSVAFYSSMTRC